jgi:hypothetical protein
MIEPGTLTGEYVRTVRQRHKLTRQAFQDLCVQFGLNGGRSVARLCNIEAKDSWKTGDREAVARAIAQLEGDAPVTPTEAVADAFDLSDPHDPIFCVDPADDDDDSLVIVMAMPADDLIVPVVDAEDDEDDVVHVEPTDPWDEFDANGLLPIFEITNSNVQTFKRCRRKWWLTWYRGLARREEDMLGIRRTGSRIHQALQAYYVPENETPTDPRDALERALTEDWTLIKQAADARGHDEFVVADMEAKFRKTADLERAMIEGYVEWITETGCDAELRVIKSETQVSAPLFDYVRADGEVQPVHALGLLDVRAYRTSDGVRMFIDHKTVGDLKTPSMTLPQNEQMLHYHLLEWLSTSDGEERCDGGSSGPRPPSRRSTIGLRCGTTNTSSSPTSAGWSRKRGTSCASPSSSTPAWIRRTSRTRGPQRTARGTVTSSPSARCSTTARASRTRSPGCTTRSIRTSDTRKRQEEVNNNVI